MVIYAPEFRAAARLSGRADERPLNAHRNANARRAGESMLGSTVSLTFRRKRKSPCARRNARTPPETNRPRAGDALSARGRSSLRIYSLSRSLAGGGRRRGARARARARPRSRTRSYGENRGCTLRESRGSFRVTSIPARYDAKRGVIARPKGVSFALRHALPFPPSSRRLRSRRIYRTDVNACGRTFCRSARACVGAGGGGKLTILLKCRT